MDKAHLSSDLIEAAGLGRPEAIPPLVKRHLAHCDLCRQKLGEAREYIEVMRQALIAIKEEESSALARRGVTQ